MDDEDLIEAMRAASGYALHREAARRVLDVVRPKGWRVVPEKPSTEMVRVGTDARWRSAIRSADCVAEIYEHMIAAAPTPPLPATRDDDPLKESF